MKGTASILFIALLLWMSGSSYWYVKYIGETTEASAPSEEVGESKVPEPQIEKDPEIFDMACERIEKETRQQNLFN